MRFEEWNHMLRQVCGHCYGVPERGQKDVNGDFLVQQVSGFEAASLSCDIVGINRTLQGTRRDDNEYFFLMLQTAGRSYIEHAGSQATMARGDICLIDSTRPATIHFNGDKAQYLSLHLPRGLVLLDADRHPRIGNRVTWNSRSVQRLYNQIRKGPDKRPVRTSQDESQTILDLVRTVFTSDKFDGTLDMVSTRKSRFELTLHELELNLVRPELSLGWLAQRVGLSQRQLERDFSDHGTSFVQTMREYRLKLAVQMIELSLRRSKPRLISEIAVDSGFRDLSNFNRAFRARFGYSPSEFANERSSGDC